MLVADTPRKQDRPLEPERALSIREAFYDETGSVTACSKPVVCEANSIAELTTLLSDLRQAFAEPSLSLSALPTPEPENPRPRTGRRLSHADVVSRLGLETLR